MSVERARYVEENPDIEAEVILFTSEQGGSRKQGVVSGYGPNHLVKQDYLTSGFHRYIDFEEGELVPLGKKVLTWIKFITPEYYPETLKVGQIVRIQEGGRFVGEAKVLSIFNQILAAKE
jgi:hypothetical protein